MAQSAAAQEQGPGAQHVFGLTVASPFALPGAARVETGTPDLVIVRGPAQLSGSAEQRGPYRRQDTRLELDIPDAGRFLLGAPGRLEVAERSDVDPEVLGAFLIASGLPMLLWQRGGLLLHASGVALGDRVIALSGPSGVGKSTIARAMLDHGGQLLGDDTLWLPDPEQPAWAQGITGGQFLRDAATGEPRFNSLPPARQAGPGNLSALVILSHEPKDPVRLGPVAAAQAVLRARHRPLVPELLDRNAAVLAHCIRLAAALPVFRLGIEPGKPEAAAAMVHRLAEGSAA